MASSPRPAAAASSTSRRSPSSPRALWPPWASTASAPDVLRRWLELDSHDPTSSHDFGKDVMPRMVAEGANVYAYQFGGYWMDVGTVQAYWEANMQLLVHAPPLDLYDRGWVIHTQSEEQPSAKIQAGAVVKRSLVSHGCIIEGTVDSSVLSPGRVRRAGRPRARLHHSQRHTHRGGRHRRALHSRQADRRRLGLPSLAARQTWPSTRCSLTRSTPASPSSARTRAFPPACASAATASSART